MYLVWFDNSAKKSVLEKIDEAIDRFQDRFGFAPDHCLVHESHAVEHPHLMVRPVRYVRPDYFQVGCEDATMANALAARKSLRVEPMVPVQVEDESRGGRRRLVSAAALAAQAPRTPVVRVAPVAVAQPVPVAELPAAKPERKAVTPSSSVVPVGVEPP
ncbi:MAG TPA: hypothetical protein VM536_11740, partial [Chloroflexia bacterium]|nr:hypothetical protein [Chloroflexia bacterium]